MHQVKLSAAMIGRFQPFHLGHLEFVRQILVENSEVIIIVGSSQANFTPHNPFTAGERIHMIRNSLIEAEICMEKVTLVHVMDDQNNYSWFRNLKTFTPPFNVLYTGNVFIKILLEKEDILLKDPIFTKKDQYNGTNIRKLIAKNDHSWERLVPESVKDIIFQIDGTERIKKLESSWSESPFNYI